MSETSSSTSDSSVTLPAFSLAEYRDFVEEDTSVFIYSEIPAAALFFADS